MSEAKKPGGLYQFPCRKCKHPNTRVYIQEYGVYMNECDVCGDKLKLSADDYGVVCRHCKQVKDPE